MKKLNKQPILSHNPILNKYLITYTKPDIWIDEIDDYFITGLLTQKMKNLLIIY